MSFKFFRSLNEGKVHSHKDFQGMDISIEIPAGGVRKGKDRDGNAWEMPIGDAYGYIKGTHSPDGEHLDCYLCKNPDPDAKIYVMHQLTVDGSKFDEDKVMLGYESPAEARSAFKAYTFKPKQMFGGMTEFTVEHFRLAAYQASNSTVMLCDQETYEDFKMRGLLPGGVKSSLDIAKKVSEAINGLADDTGFCVVLQSQAITKLSEASWHWGHPVITLIKECETFGEARAAAANASSGILPVNIPTGHQVTSIDVLTTANYRQFHESDQLVVEEIRDDYCLDEDNAEVEEEITETKHTPKANSTLPLPRNRGGSYFGWLYGRDEDDNGDGVDGGDSGSVGESLEEDPTLDYHVQMRTHDDQYVDRYANIPEPPCTCSQEQLNAVGCDCDRDSWQYTQTVLHNRAKYPEVFGSNEITEGEKEVPSFASEQEAWDWFDEQLGDEQNKDNFRFAYTDKPNQVASFEKKSVNGCCGSWEPEVTIGGRTAWLGCNYGH